MTAALVLLHAATALAEEGGLEPPPPELTLLRVSSVPPRAEVSVDGHACGETPALVEVAPGRHEVVVVLGDRTFEGVIHAVPGETVEVGFDVETGTATGLAPAAPRRAPPPAPPRRPSGPPVGQTRDREPPRAPRRGAREREEDEGPRVAWHRDVPESPWADVQVYVGALARTFDLPINPGVDVLSRSLIQLDSGAVALMGVRGAVYPAAGARTRALRGLGVEGGYGAVVGMEVRNDREGTLVESGYYEADAGLVYRLALGSVDVGATLVFRIGWHRTEFYLGEAGNDLLPPFTYDTVRVGAGVSVPLFTRHVAAQVLASYLGVVGLQGTREYGVEQAYGGEGTDFTSHGGEVSIGLVGRVGHFDAGLHWVGRWMNSAFEGAGSGWGSDYPSTRVGLGGMGILTDGDAADSYQQFRFTITYRI